MSDDDDQPRSKRKHSKRKKSSRRRKTHDDEDEPREEPLVKVEPAKADLPAATAESDGDSDMAHEAGSESDDDDEPKPPAISPRSDAPRPVSPIASNGPGLPARQAEPLESSAPLVPSSVSSIVDILSPKPDSSNKSSGSGSREGRREKGSVLGKRKKTQSSAKVYTEEDLEAFLANPPPIPEYNPNPDEFEQSLDKCSVKLIDGLEPRVGATVFYSSKTANSGQPDIVLSIGIEFPFKISDDDKALETFAKYIQPCHIGQLQDGKGNNYRQRQFIHRDGKCWHINSTLVNHIDSRFRIKQLLKNNKSYEFYRICFFHNRYRNGRSIIMDDVYYRQNKLNTRLPINTVNSTIKHRFKSYEKKRARLDKSRGRRGSSTLETAAAVQGWLTLIPGSSSSSSSSLSSASSGLGSAPLSAAAQKDMNESANIFPLLLDIIEHSPRDRLAQILTEVRSNFSACLAHLVDDMAELSRQNPRILCELLDPLRHIKNAQDLRKASAGPNGWYILVLSHAVLSDKIRGSKDLGGLVQQLTAATKALRPDL